MIRDFQNWIDLNFEKLVSIRRWLHMNPEIGFSEYKTSDYLKKLFATHVEAMDQAKQSGGIPPMSKNMTKNFK